MKKTFILLFLFIGCLNISANNIQISNVNISSSDLVVGYAMVGFDISWENSWRDSENYDAAWIFIKFRSSGSSGSWSHATLHYVNGNSDGHIAASGSVINTPSDGKGVFIYRDATGNGNNAFTNVLLRWDFAADGVSAATDIDIKVHGIEMVYIPQGQFYAGDGSTGVIAGQFESGTSGNPFLVSSESSITLGGGTPGSMGNNNRTGMANNGMYSISPISIDDFDDATSQTLPASFPKGYAPFYCMKYEITQEEYVEFLNSLDPVQFQTRYTSINANINGITGLSWNAQPNRFNISAYTNHPNLSTSTPNLPMIFIESYDAAAFGDWSGLRPMTELEFEKACRGPLTPITNEYAWGTNTINTNSYTLNNINQTNEGISNNYSLVAGNAWYNTTLSGSFPCRVGIFAANGANTGRVSSGASYYGVMELSGNCWERCVSVGRPKGRAFTGSHGDGMVGVNGNATNSDWPGFTSGTGVDHAEGYGYRGGGFYFPDPVINNLRVSSRIVATAFYNDAIFDDTARFVRTAP